MVGGVLVVLEHLFEAVEVETIANVVLVDPGEKGVVFEVAEPADPAVVLLRSVAVRRLHHLHIFVFIFIQRLSIA